MDERKGRAEAKRRGLATSCTLGVLIDAGDAGLTHPAEDYRRLVTETTFRTSERLAEEFFRRAGEAG